MMWIARVGLVGVMVVGIAACGGEPSAPGGGEVSIDNTTGSSETVLTAAPTVPSSDELAVIVTASGGGGMITSVGVADLNVVGGTGAADPWLRFRLTLNHCCFEPNSIVFPSDQWSVDVPGTTLAVAGPACGDAIVCSETQRQLVFDPSGTIAAPFEVFRSDTASVSAGTFTVQLQPVFHWVDDVIDPEIVDITLRFDISYVRPDPNGDTTPTATSHRPVTVVGAGLGLIEFPFAAAADSPGALADLVAGSQQPIDTDELAIDWTTQAALVVSIGSDLCPPILDHLDVAGNAATVVFVNPGYLECEAPLLSYTVIAAVDRDVLQGTTELRLRDDDPTVVDISVTPGSGTTPVVPIVADFGDRLGVVALPPVGEAVTGRLDDGTPVFVVHHHDGTVSALDPRGADQSVGGLFQIVRWVAATRNFLGHGAWDEFGRRLDGFRSSDLHSYATRVSDGNVEIGQPVPTPAGSPITANTDPPAMTDRPITVDHLLDIPAALELAPGTTAWIDGSVYALVDGATICAEPGSLTHTTQPPLTTAPAPIGCPAGAPIAAGITGTAGYYKYYGGPLLATRTDTGFERVASTGGYGGSTLPG